MPLLKTSTDKGILTIHFVESKILDALTIQKMQDELFAILGKTEEPNVLLDFRAVNFLSSAALGMLVRAHKKCKEYKANLILCNLAPSIREVFAITNLDKVLTICADSEEAERAFNQKGRFFR